MSHITKVPNGVKKLPKILIASVGCTNVTDRRQTDGRTTTYSDDSFAKNLYRSFFRFVTIHVFDRQTDGQLSHR